MRDNNTKDRADFISDTVFWGIMTGFWFRKSLFTCIGNFSLKESLWIFVSLTAGFVLLGTLVDLEHDRNDRSISRNLLGGLGIYQVLSYYPLQRKFILPVLAGAAFCFAVSVLMTFWLGAGKETGLGAGRKVLASLKAFRTIIGAAGGLVLVCIIVTSLCRAGLYSPSVKAADSSVLQDQTIEKQMETLVRLEEDTWQTLSLEEKLDALQTIANIERRYLGIPHEINVAAEYLEESHAAQYEERQHRIVINIDHLREGTAWDNVDTLTHEARHCYQHCLTEAYESADRDLKSLRIFKEARTYMEEFSSYKDGDQDYEGYYNQACETDARDYAESAAYEYMSRVYAYIYEQEETEGFAYTD